MNIQNRQAGFTLVELMIGIVLGLLVTGITISLFIESRKGSRQDTEISRLQENGRFALLLLSRDLAHAGFLGNMQIPERPVTPTPISSDCADAFFDAFDNPIEIVTTGTLSCYDYDGVSATDRAIVIKRVAGKPVKVGETLASDKYYFSSTGDGGAIAVGSGSAAPAGTTQYWEYIVNIYFVRNNANNIPALYRKQLTTSGVGDPVEITPGIRAFAVLFGIDEQTSDDGIADSYVSSTTVSLSRAVSAQLKILAQTIERDYSYKHDKQYTLFPGSTTSFGLNTEENYYARVFSTSVLIRNNASRNAIY